MAMTLVESAKLSTDVVLKGVIETMITESEVLQKLPFIDIVGNGLTYNQELTLPGAGFYGPNDIWNESTPTFRQATAVLSILGGDADVDEFLRQTRSNIQDLKAIVTEEKSKAIARKFDYTFVYGLTSSDAKSFNGLHYLVGVQAIPTSDAPDSGLYQAVHGSTTGNTVGAGGLISKLRTLIRKIKPGKPDYLIMNRDVRDGLSAFAERATSPIRYAIAEFGKRIMTFDDIPILIDDWITSDELLASGVYSAATGGAAAGSAATTATSSIFAVKFGEQKLVGCQNGGIVIKDLGDLETKDASRVRIKWYCSMALMNMLSAAVYDGILPLTAWAA